MKVLAFILSTIIGTALVTGGALLIALQSPGRAIGLDLLGIFALTILVYGPLMLGSMTAYWDVKRSEGSRSYFRRYLWVVVGLEAAAAVAIVVFAVLAGAEVWLPVLFVGGGVVLTAVGLVVGRLLNRYERAHPRPEENWAPVGRREVQRKVVIVAVTFVVALVLGLVLFGVVLEDGDGIGATIVLTVVFAALAGAVAAMIVTVPLNRRLREASGGDLGSMRKLGKVVLNRKPIELDEEERVAAVKYASIMPVILAFSLGWFTLLYLAIGLNQVVQMVSGHYSPLSAGSIAILAGMLVFLYPYYIVRIRRARRYARDHAGELTTPVETS